MNDPVFNVRQRDAVLRSDFLAFSQKAFGMLYPSETYISEWCHEAIAAVLPGQENHKVRQIINAPPRSLKSILVSVCWPAFKLGQDPTFKIVGASYSQLLANTLSSECRRLMQSEWYQTLFRTELIKSAEDDLVTTAGGFRRATSVGGTLTGLGGDTLIIDDPLNANDALSEAIRTYVNEWFTGNLMPRLNDKAAGAIIVVMQRLHQDDLTGHLMQIGGWDRLSLPAIAPHDTTVRLLRGSYYWREGEALQKHEPLEVLQGLKRQAGTTQFNAIYLQEPLPELGNMLRREWLRYCELVPTQQPEDQIIQSWDTAMKATPTSNYSAGLTFLVRNNQYYLIDVFHERVDFPDLCAAVQAHAHKHQPNAILIEEHASGISLIQECKQRKRMSNILPCRKRTDKKTRMNGETPKLEAGSLIVPRSAPWLGDFLEEYLSFPGGKYDDQIDALSQFLNWRTAAENRTEFSADFGHEESQISNLQFGVPSADEMMWLLRH